MEAKILELEAKIAEITEENEVLRKQLVKVGALGDTEKERLLKQVLKEHPDCYSQIEFDDAFKEAAEK